MSRKFEGLVNSINIKLTEDDIKKIHILKDKYSINISALVRKSILDIFYKLEGNK